MKTKSISGVLFDLDQTLIDFLKMKRYSCKAAIDAMIKSGLVIKKKKAERILFELYDRHGIEDPLIFQRFLAKVNRKIDYPLLAKAIAAYRKAQRTVLQPYPNARQTLSKLKRKGIKLGVVSDASRIKAHVRLAEMDLADFFEVIIALEDTGKTKPHPAPFRKAIQKLRIPAEKILFVGDNPHRDIAGAKAVGMKTAWAKYGHPAKYFGSKTEAKGRPKPDYTLRRFAQLNKIFR